jgi:hypothetical protein
MGEEGMAGHISKGPVHRKIDKRIRAMTREQRQNFAEALRGTQDYFEVLRNFEVGLTRQEEDYLRAKWYIQPPPWHGFWRGQQPIMPIIRQGLAFALDKSIENNQRLPVDSYWMTGGNNARVQVFVTVSPEQVTRIIYTPPSETPQGLSRPERVNIWVMKEGQETADEDELHFEDAVIVVPDRKRIVRMQRQEFREGSTTP